MKRLYAPWPAAPGNGATIVMFCTHPRQPGGAGSPVQASIRDIDQSRIAAVTITWLRNDQASAANGLRVYALDNIGVFREIDLKNDSNVASIGAVAPVQVPVLAGGQEWRETLVVPHCRGLAVEYTAATGPTNWNGVIAVDTEGLVVTR